MLQSLLRNFGFTEVTPSRNRKERRCILWLFARFFVTLASPKLLSLGKAQTSLTSSNFVTTQQRKILSLCFRCSKVWLFARFFVTLTPSKLLSLGKAQTSLAFRSFIRNFAPNFNKNKKPQ